MPEAEETCRFLKDYGKNTVLCLYQNRKLKHPYLPDIKLAPAAVEFREAEMPIYIADYQALKNENQENK